MQPGRLCYFPNIVISMIRSGVQHSSDVVKFKVPKYMNKYDLEEYLQKLYKVSIQSISFTNFPSQGKMRGQYQPAKKIAQVQIIGDFNFPE
jgi:ribosomal protein L23